ncbi:unnamed protein product, partial [Prorocentrum cordatum]
GQGFPAQQNKSMAQGVDLKRPVASMLAWPADMWSLGVMTYILLDGRPPFQGPNDRATCKRIRTGLYSFPAERWHRISNAARDFVRALLEIDPNRRLSAEEALDHEWLKVDWALDSDEAAPPLDAEVLEGMRAFARSNCLKRAVLSAVAPVATVEKVSHWADQFEALDVRKEGTVSVKDSGATIGGERLRGGRIDPPLLLLLSLLLLLVLVLLLLLLLLLLILLLLLLIPMGDRWPHPAQELADSPSGAFQRGSEQTVSESRAQLDVEPDFPHADVTAASPTSPVHRQCIADTSPMHR